MQKTVRKITGGFCNSSFTSTLVASVIAVRRQLSSPSILSNLHLWFSTNTTYEDVDFYQQYDFRRSWNNFYKRHQNKFFKDRHYLVKDWGLYFSDDPTLYPNGGKTVLEVGCGAGNTIFPLLAAYPKLFVYACDFSPHAVSLIKAHTKFTEERINVFACNIAEDNICDYIVPSSIDVITLIFMLSAVSPKKMSFVIQNLKKVLKPNGHILLRDYAIGDFAQVKLQNRKQIISENFYFRGDGTTAFYFSEELLSSLFVRAGFTVVDVDTYCREIENRSRNITMQRRWLRAIFSLI